MRSSLWTILNELILDLGLNINKRKRSNVIEALQAHQTIILIKSYLLVNDLFVKSIFYSKCQIYSFALQIG